ncbi:hypothetical protein [Corynebacterium lubricantis]|uniref:hypothetical protein n=1 Tax=Corynebacterium lubricantis TaxID=541095 RepID=UPI00035FA305|nr:hypothetical protein [Corynebacterium lubricantis]
MSENDAGGQTRIDAAKQAATTLIEDISDSTDLGFTYYGGNTSEDMAAYERGCQDVSVVRGPERGNSEELTTAIAALEPGGFTPIGKALIDSADELPEGDNIVLVSDGLANCTPPDICEVATDLSDSGVNLVINAIGFNVDLQARSELECIAESGGGIYADASDADSLIDALKRATTRQYVAYDSAVQDIQGSEAIDAAPEVPRNVSEFSTKIPPAADPHDSGSGGTSLYWRIPVEKGESLSIASNTVVEPTVVTYDPGTLYLTPRLHENADSQTPSGNRCSTYIDSLGENNFRGIQSVSLVSEKIGTPNCDTSEVILEIERRGDYRDGADLLSEITIRRFGEVDQSTVTPAAQETELGTPVSAEEEAEPITPGTWFIDATPLDLAGQNVTTNIVPGETHFYSVPIGYGQMLQGGIRATLNQAEEQGNSALGDALVLDAFNPGRASVPLTNRYPSARVSETFDPFAYKAPISHGNLSSTGLESAWLGGTHYLAVTYAPFNETEDVSAEDQLLTLEYELANAAAGEEVDPPVFAALGGGAADATAETTPQPVDSTTLEAAGTEESNNGLSYALGGLGVVVLLGIIAAIIFISRKYNGNQWTRPRGRFQYRPR